MNNSMNDLMNLISVLCGGYCLYTWFRLVREKKLFMSSVLLPKDRKPSDCLDEEGYIKPIRPKLGILGLVILLFGVFSAINERCDPPILEFPWTFVPWGIEAVVLICYVVTSSDHTTFTPTGVSCRGDFLPVCGCKMRWRVIN